MAGGGGGQVGGAGGRIGEDKESGRRRAGGRVCSPQDLDQKTSDFFADQNSAPNFAITNPVDTRWRIVFIENLRKV